MALKGPSGEPVDVVRSLLSHGLASLPPMSIQPTPPSLEVTLALKSGRPRTVGITPSNDSTVRVQVRGRPVGSRAEEEIKLLVRRLFNLGEDLSEFYAAAAEDPGLSWVVSGAGRMMRSPTVFEDVVKTICTTNCSWSLTEKMVGALVEQLGEPAPDAPAEAVAGRAFPTAAAMAGVNERFYRDVVRAGYRSPHLLALARNVANRDVDLEELARAGPDELSDEEVDERLQSLPGIGPYAAAHIMMLLGRHSRLILDSWTRPKFARVAGMKSARDTTIVRRFKRYGRYAGLAFWLYITRDWVEDASILD